MPGPESDGPVPDGTRVDVVPLDTPRLLSAAWDDVLAVSFPAAELTPLDALQAEHRAGRLLADGVVRDGHVVAAIVASWSPRTHVVLVDYLAIVPGSRGGGLGGALLDGALERWRRELAPALVLAEVEHPAHHAASASFGDPTARLRFYARHGARVLALPYFQPGITGPGSPRVPALLLVALGTGADDAVPAGPLRAFLTEHLVACEGMLATDSATRRLLDAAAGEAVALVDPADPAALATVPVGLLEGDERRAPPSPA